MKHIYWLGFLGIASFGAFFANPCFAQTSNIIPDNSLGAESSQVIENFQGSPLEAIAGGAQRGINLFHSFREFNVSEGRGAYFLSPNAEIQNILTRVTGNNASEILGILGSFGGSQPNLFLINPNGILFGEKASLDLQGSFVASTANGIQFGEQGVFSATNPEAPALLSVNPSALFFNQISSRNNITVRSVTPAGTSPSGINIVGLRVPDSRSFLLVGGDIVFEGGQSSALGGHLELGGLNEPGSIELEVSDETFKLSFPENFLLSNVTLKDDARVSVRGAGGGNLIVNANTFTATNGGRLVAGTEKPLRGGDITVNANDFITNGVGSSGFASGLYNQTVIDAIGSPGNIFVNSKNLNASSGAMIQNNVNSGAEGDAGDININTEEISLTDGALIWSLNFGNGNAGNLNIDTERLIVRDGGQVATKTFGKGKTGNLNISASESIELIGSIQRGFSQSGLYVQVGQTGDGDARDLNIETNRLIVVNGAQVNATTFGKGDGGNLKIRASEIELLGTTADGIFPSALQVRVEPGAEGNGGNLTIETQKLSVRDGARVAADTTSSGNAGNLFIQAKDLIEVSGVSVIGFPSLLNAGINRGAVGNGGNLTVETNQIIVRDGGAISTSTFGKGATGNLDIRASESIELIGSTQRGFSQSGLYVQVGQTGDGDARDLNIETNRLIVVDGAQVNATTFGKGDGGNLKIRASEIELLGTTADGIFPSALQVRVEPGAEGNGGNLTIETQKLSVRNGARVAADTTSSGNAGNLFIQAKDLIEVSGVSVIGASSRLTTAVNEGAVGNGDNLTIETSKLIVRDGGQVLTSTFGDGNAGDLTINADNIKINGISGSSISGLFVNSGSATGTAGDIIVSSPEITLSNQGRIDAESTSGNGGNINLQVSDLLLFRRGAQISTNAGTAQQGGDGGNIDINSKFIVALPQENSDITANAFEGRGGNINILSQGIFGIQPRQQESDLTSDITASSDLGVPGNLNITDPDDSNIRNNLDDLPDNQIDTDSLIANSCISRSNKRQENSFTITGSGGLRNSPGDELISIYSTGDVRNVESTSRSWKKGDRIIEPTGVYKLSDGRLLLSRECGSRSKE